MEITALDTINLSTNGFLSETLRNLIAEIEAAAKSDLAGAFTNDEFTNPEKKSMLVFRMMELAREAMTASEVILAGVLSYYEDTHLYSVHPQGFTTITQAANAAGISVSEYSQMRSLWKIVIPYLQEIGIDIVQSWSEIGKSNMRALTPALVSVITGELSRSEKTRDFVERVQNEVIESLGTPPKTREEILGYNKLLKMFTVNNMLALGAGSYRDVREGIGKTKSQPAFILYKNGRRFLIADLEPDAETFLRRNSVFDLFYFDVRQNRLETIPPIKEILHELGTDSNSNST